MKTGRLNVPAPSTLPDAGGFPSARYFQLHFEQLYGLIQGLNQRLDAANRELSALRELLGKTEESALGSSPPARRRKQTADAGIHPRDRDF